MPYSDFKMLIDDEKLFPAGTYDLEKIREIIVSNSEIPDSEKIKKNHKSYDDWEHKVSQALYHSKRVNSISGQPGKHLFT